MTRQNAESSVVESSAAASDPNALSRRSSWVMAGGSLLFAVLQSACTAVMAISGLRLLIGITSLTAASIPAFMMKIHADRIRVPMLVVAVIGSGVDLYVLWRIRSLRSRPASQWRMQPVSAKQRRSEFVQLMLSLLTLVLVMLEVVAHYRMRGTM